MTNRKKKKTQPRASEAARSWRSSARGRRALTKREARQCIRDNALLKKQNEGLEQTITFLTARNNTLRYLLRALVAGVGVTNSTPSGYEDALAFVVEETLENTSIKERP